MKVNLNPSKRGNISPVAGAVFLAVIFFLAALPAFSQEFGVVLDNKAELKDGGNPFGDVEYTGTALPWFAAPLGDKAGLYLSGGISAWYSDEKWKPLPEIRRFEVTFDPRPGLRVEIGRLPFGENSRAMAGLLDGVSFRLNAGGGRLGGGVFYTGLLYKKAACIVMSPEDRTGYEDGETYFASRRIAASVNWERAGIFNTRGAFSAGGAAQFDLNGGSALFHSQYLEAGVKAPLIGRARAGFGWAVELAEETGKDLRAAFELSAEFHRPLLPAMQDRLSLAGWFSSGDWNGRLGPFTPLTARARGKVLQSESSGVALVEAAYTARLHPKFAADLYAAYYFRTDTVTFRHSGIDRSSASPFVGGEAYGGFTWAFFSDVLLSAGGGVFLPRTGKAFRDGAAPVYRAVLEAGISF
ncbi:MAG: hypothetical protein LBL44_09340 [Treponema sp.]|jgi:hypothetical protein|nr:hypothetical protein [Treponema sp.]